MSKRVWSFGSDQETKAALYEVNWRAGLYCIALFFLAGALFATLALVADVKLAHIPRFREQIPEHIADIIIDLAFLALAIYAIVRNHKRIRNLERKSLGRFSFFGQYKLIDKEDRSS